MVTPGLGADLAADFQSEVVEFLGTVGGWLSARCAWSEAVVSTRRSAAPTGSEVVIAGGGRPSEGGAPLVPWCGECAQSVPQHVQVPAYSRVVGGPPCQLVEREHVFPGEVDVALPSEAPVRA